MRQVVGFELLELQEKCRLVAGTWHLALLGQDKEPQNEEDKSSVIGISPTQSMTVTRKTLREGSKPGHNRQQQEYIVMEVQVIYNQENYDDEFCEYVIVQLYALH